MSIDQAILPLLHSDSHSVTEFFPDPPCESIDIFQAGRRSLAGQFTDRDKSGIHGMSRNFRCWDDMKISMN